MKGFPKNINTKQDILNLLPDFPTETTEYLRKLLDERKHWQDGNYVENPNAVLFQMGFTTQEALAIVTDYVEPPTPEPPLTPEQEAERELLAWRATADCSKRELYLALDETTLPDNTNALDTITAWVNHPDTPRAVKIEWETSYRYARRSPLISAFAPQFGLTEEQVDNIVKLAQSKGI